MVCLMLGAATLSACTSWQVQTVSPEQVIATQNPPAVRVQRLDGSRVVVDSPRIGGDSLVGATGGKPTGVPLADIYQLAIRHDDGAKSVGLVLVVAAGAFLILVGMVAIACSGGGCD